MCVCVGGEGERHFFLLFAFDLCKEAVVAYLCHCIEEGAHTNN